MDKYISHNSHHVLLHCYCKLMKSQNYLSKLSPLMKEEVNKRQIVCMCVRARVRAYMRAGVCTCVLHDACLVELFFELDYEFFAAQTLIFLHAYSGEHKDVFSHPQKSPILCLIPFCGLYGDMFSWSKGL